MSSTDEGKQLAQNPGLETILDFVPDLEGEHRKGQHGRLGVVGGSLYYVGAPYFSGMSALRLGADLCCVFCGGEASTPLKTLSPDLMVDPLLAHTGAALPFMTDLEWEPSASALAKVKADFTELSRKPNITPQEIEAAQQRQLELVFEVEQQTMAYKSTLEDCVTRFQKWLPRLNVLAVGPGLGKSKLASEVAARAILMARKQNMPIVVDADGIRLVQLIPAALFMYDKAIITPNSAEFSRLYEALSSNDLSTEALLNAGNATVKQLEDYGASIAADIDVVVISEKDKFEGLRHAQEVAQRLGGVTILRKGKFDIITNGFERPAYAVREKGSLKRCGGLGDILTGCTATWVYWSSTVLKETSYSAKSLIPLAAVAASLTSRRASRLAFSSLGRSLVANDVLSFIGTGFEQIVKALRTMKP